MECSEPVMNEQQQYQHKKEQFFCNLAAALADGKLPPKNACSMIEELRDIKIFADDILEPKTREEEQQKGFNEIAAVYADYQITKEEACEFFNEWIDEWKHVRS